MTGPDRAISRQRLARQVAGGGLGGVAGMLVFLALLIAVVFPRLHELSTPEGVAFRGLIYAMAVAAAASLVGLAGAVVAARWARYGARPVAGAHRLAVGSVTWLGAAAVVLAVAYLGFGYPYYATLQQVQVFWIALLIHAAVTDAAHGPRPPVRIIAVGVALTVIVYGAAPVAGYLLPYGPAGGATPEEAVTEYVDAITAGDRERLLDLAGPDQRRLDSVRLELDALLEQVSGRRLVVTDVQIADRSGGSAQAELAGTADGVPFCGGVTVDRYDTYPLRPLLRPMRGEGRWFVSPRPFRAEELDGSACQE